MIVKAPTKEELTTLFQPDEYVRDGYMTLNATLSVAHKPPATEGIDASGVEEGRIIQILRTSTIATGGERQADHAFLQFLLDKGTIGAWYSMENGPVSEVLFSRTTDTKMLKDTFAPYPAAKAGAAKIVVWRQWLSKGVVK